MEEKIEQIAQRLKGLRDALDITVEDAAKNCEVSKSEYMTLESGRVDIPVSILHRMSTTYGVELSSILCGDEPHLRAYSLTRADHGMDVTRKNAYNYQAHAHAFMNKSAEPFIVTVPASEIPPSFSSHKGQEFNYVIEGKLKIYLDGKEIVLNEGDSLYYDSTLKHGMTAMDGEPAKFVAVIM